VSERAREQASGVRWKRTARCRETRKRPRPTKPTYHTTASRHQSVFTSSACSRSDSPSARVHSASSASRVWWFSSRAFTRASPFRPRARDHSTRVLTRASAPRPRRVHPSRVVLARRRRSTPKTVHGRRPSPASRPSPLVSRARSTSNETHAPR